MLLFIITLLVSIIGFIVFASTDDDAVITIGGIFFGVGAIVGVIMMLMIIAEHAGVNATITENQIEYESLCERKELISSEYEDVSRSDVIKDIAEWNKNVYSYQHWAYNPWTSWFYSKKIADSMEMIE
jgi:hypothetical protein